MIFSDVPLINITQCVSWSPGVEVVQRLGSPKSLRSFWDPEKTEVINITNSNKSTFFSVEITENMFETCVSSLILPKRKQNFFSHDSWNPNGPKKKQSEKRPHPTASNQRSTGSTAWRANALADTKRHSFCSRSCCKRLRLPSDPTWDVSDVCFPKIKWPIPMSWCLIGTFLVGNQWCSEFVVVFSRSLSSLRKNQAYCTSFGFVSHKIPCARTVGYGALKQPLNFATSPKPCISNVGYKRTSEWC